MSAAVLLAPVLNAVASPLLHFCKAPTLGLICPAKGEQNRCLREAAKGLLSLCQAVAVLSGW